MFKKTLISAIALAGAAAGSSQAQAADLTISCGAVGAELTLCEEGVAQWEEKTGHEVDIVSTPNSSTERLSLYQQILSAQSSDIDVMQTDVVWPGLLANHLLDLSETLGEDAAEGHFEAIVANNTIDDRLVAMPWFTDAGVLYYRKDLLEEHGFEAPETWEELTCNALEWIASYGGGTIVDAEGEITIDNAQAAEALDLAASWIGNISPKGVLNYTEEEARGIFQSGNAVFMRNWPYAWSLAQSEDSNVRDKVGAVKLPSAEGQESAATLGGWNLAVSRYTENPELAADLVAFLTGEAEQKRRAIEGAYNPTLASLYEDEEVLEAVPFFGTLYDTFTNAVARPSAPTGDNYGRVSNSFFNAVHQVLSGDQSGAEAVSQVDSELSRIKRRRW
jgi:trehalose/maltose transport system substrate-binding protein